MKKRLFLSIMMLLALCLVLVGCQQHEHSYSESWTYDETNHWHVCACGEKDGLAEHTWDEGVVTTEATRSSKGEKTYTCTVCGLTKTEEIDELKNVSTVINGKNNDSVEFIAVIFGFVSDGFYASDESAGVYVKLSTANANLLNTLKVGDQVKVTGKLSVSSSAIFIKNGNATVLYSGKTSAHAEVTTLDKVNALTASDREAFGKLFTVTVAVDYDAADRMIWKDATGEIVIADSVAANFESYVGKKITANLVLTSYIDGWTAYGFADTASEYFVDVNDIKDTIYDNIELDSEVYGVMDLVTSYEVEPNVVFTWSVKEGTALTIEDGKAYADLTLAEDTEVTLVLTLTSGETTAKKEFTTTVKAIRSLSIADAKTTADEYILVSGLVVGKGIADETGKIHYIILMDEETQELITIDCKSELRDATNVGETIQVVAKYRTEERPSLTDVKFTKVTAEAKEIDYSTLNPTRLETVEDYQYAIDNYHDEVRLYVIVNPYMVGSGSTSYSWNQFGPTKTAAASGLIKSRQFSLLISNFAANGLTDWVANYQVPTKAVGAKFYPGTVMYVYSIYQTGETKWSFMIPSAAACQYQVNEAVKVEVQNSISNEITANEAGTFALPTSVTLNEVEYALTWTSSNEELLNGTTGAYARVFDDATVTLTASFTIEEVVYTTDIIVNMLAGVIEPVTVSEAIAAGSAVVGKLQAYVAAIGASSENNTEYRSGIMLTDGKQVIYYDTKDYKVGDTDLLPGDFIEIKAGTLTVNADGNTIVEGTVTLLSTGNTIDYSELQYITISSETELATFLAAHNSTHGLVVKFVGPFNFVGTGSTSTNPRYQLNYKEAKSSASARYPFADYAVAEDGTVSGARTVSFSMPSSKDLLGNEWWTECGLPEKSGSKCYTVYGEFYAVGGYNGNTLQAWTIINAAGFNLCEPTAIQNAIAEEYANPTINAAEAGTIELLSKVTVGEVDYPLTWTTSDSNVVSDAGAYAAQSSDVTATLTATYTVKGVQFTTAIEFTFKAKEIVTVSVSEAIAAGSATGVVIDKLEAYVAALSQTTNASGAYVDGVMLTDGKKVIYYPTALTVGEHTLVANDKIYVYGGTLTVDADVHRLEGGTIELISSANTIDYTNLVIDATITTNDELVAFMAAHNPTQGLVVKFTGNFSIVGTGSSSTNPRYQLNFANATSSAKARYAYKDYVDATHGNRTISFQTKAVKDLLGTDWWTDFGATAEATGSKCFKGTGTIYAVGGMYGATMQGWTIINPSAYSVTANNE